MERGEEDGLRGRGWEGERERMGGWEGEDGRVGGRDSDVNLTFIPFSLIFFISSVGFSDHKMKWHYITAHRKTNHSMAA